MFKLELRFIETDIGFNETQEDFNSYISFLTNNWKQIMITHVPPLLNDHEFKDYIQ